MGLTKHDKPDVIEEDLMKLVPREQWTFFGPATVLHGRYTCTAKKPKCEECVFKDFCPRIGV
jgi:endonuclease-3